MITESRACLLEITGTGAPNPSMSNQDIPLPRRALGARETRCAPRRCTGARTTCWKQWGSAATTPLLGRFTLETTWANVSEHATGPPDYWGSRGRGFKSRRPDADKALTSINAGQGLMFVYGVLNRPPKTPRKLVSAIRFGPDSWSTGSSRPGGPVQHAHRHRPARVATGTATSPPDTVVGSAAGWIAPARSAHPRWSDGRPSE